MRKKLLLSALFAAIFTLSLSACDNATGPDYSKDERYKIYLLATDSGYTGTYEEWLKSIKGQDGKDGHSPIIEIKDGYWYIDNVNTSVKAEGSDGANGINGNDGTSMLNGNGVPSAELGSVGDSYINLETWDYYVKDSDGWKVKGNIKGKDYEKEVHTVTFDSNGGTPVESQKVLHGEKITKPNNPILADYDFAGWTYQNEPWSFIGYVVTSDMTLKANWTPYTYTVTFKNDDGTVLETQNNLHYGDTVSYHGEEPVKPNPEVGYYYIFKGWDKKLVVTGDMVFVAQYDRTEGIPDLRIAAGYQAPSEAISFQDAYVVGDGLTLSDGKTYHVGDLKPTWEYLESELNVNFIDKFTGAGSAEREWNAWQNKLNEVDIVAGSVAKLNAAGAQGKLIDLSQYLDKMPNFKSYLENNTVAQLSITGIKPNSGELGAIYFSPYFDGVDDIERVPLMRADLVRKLLDDNSFVGANRQINEFHYQPYMPTTGTVSVRSVTANGENKIVTKDYSKYGNIIKRMNETPNLDGNTALSMFKEYIKKTYNGYYDGRLSDLFLGYDAAWDADEMVALFRVAHAQLNDLDENPLVPLFSRETGNMQRNVDLYRFAGSLFGVRGMESRSDYLYFGNDGRLHDARCDKESFEAVERMHNLVLEGLVTVDGSAKSNNYLEKDAGLMSYDYNQTQTIYNDILTYYQPDGSKKTFAETGREYRAVMVPVAKWDDGDDDTPEYMRFTESWRSVKTDGWAISAAGVEGKPEKLDAALKLIDFAYSVQGQITMSYGPDTFIKVKSTWDKTQKLTSWDEVSEKYETFNFNGTQMPVISEGCRTDLVEKSQGNYTNFGRRYLGSTLNGFPKSQAFEYQCTSENGQIGSAVLSAAIDAGIIKHPVSSVNDDNMWYTSVPTTLPVTANQQKSLDSYTNLINHFATAKNTKNVFYQIIKGGYEKSGGDTAIGPMNAADFAAKVKSTEEDGWKGNSYLDVRNEQWEALYAYYLTL